MLRCLLLPAAALCVCACSSDLLSPVRENGAAASVRAPAAASELTASSNSDTRVNLNWPDNVKNELGWEVHRASSPTETFTLRASRPVNSTAWDDLDLTARTQYCYKVRSFKKSGSTFSYAAFSNVACVTTLGPPVAPSLLVAMPRNSAAVDVSWTDNSPDEGSFRIEIAATTDGPWTAVGSVPANVLTFLHSWSGASEQQACYRVVAVNFLGQTASAPDCTVPPRRVSDIWPTPNSSSIDVSWTDASNAEDGYEVQRLVPGGAWLTIANLAANSTTTRDADVLVDIVYQYRVRAMRDGGFSDFSRVVAASVTNGPPVTPTMSKAFPLSSTVASVVWSNETPGTAEILVERSVDGQVTWNQAGIAHAGQGTFEDSGRTTEEPVCYRVTARNSFGASAPSGLDCTVTPAAPTDITASAWAEGGIYITFNNRSNYAGVFDIVLTACSPAGCVTRTSQLGVDFGPGSAFLYSDRDDEFVEAIYASFDDGRSDAGTWAEAAALGVNSRAGRITVPLAAPPRKKPGTR